MNGSNNDFRSKTFTTTNINIVVDDPLLITDSYITNILKSNPPKVFETAAQTFIGLSDVRRPTITVGGIDYEIVASLAAKDIPVFSSQKQRKEFIASYTSLPPSKPTGFPTSPVGNPPNPQIFEPCPCPPAPKFEDIPYPMYVYDPENPRQCGWIKAVVWCHGSISRTTTIACCKDASPDCDPLNPTSPVDIISEDDAYDPWDDWKEIQTPTPPPLEYEPGYGPGTPNWDPEYPDIGTKSGPIIIGGPVSIETNEYVTRFRDENGRNCARIDLVRKTCSTILVIEFSKGCGNTIPPMIPGIGSPIINSQ
jgi:hypothetical protein